MADLKAENLFYTADRQEWRNWLSSHFETAADVWFVFPTKASGEASLSYNDAVEEALCFGWIDRFTSPGSAFHAPEPEKLLFPAEHRTPDLAGRAGTDPPEGPSFRGEDSHR